MFQTKLTEIMKTHILCSMTFLGYLAVYEIMWTEMFKVRQAIDENMAHAHCMLDN